LLLGDLENAEECADRALEALKAVGSGGEIARAYRHIDQIALCRGDWEGAVEAFQKAVQLLELGNHPDLSRATYLLGRAYLAKQDREESLRRFQESVALEVEGLGWLKRDPYVLFNRLSGLEAVYDDSTSFRAFCSRLREERPALSDLPLTQ